MTMQHSYGCIAGGSHATSSKQPSARLPQASSSAQRHTRSRRWPAKALLIAALCLLVAAATTVTAKATTRGNHNDPRRIRMDSLKTLYFKDGMQTWSRRDKRLPQLQCVGNSKHICKTYAPDIVVCQHIGDGAWRCEADLHKSVRMGSVDVSCEGWDGPHDEYVLRGSCLLKYNLLPAYKDNSDFDTPIDKDRNSLMLIVIIAVFFAILWYNNRRPAPPAPGGGGPRGGGGGGGGGPGWFGGWGGGPAGPPQDAPPPYRPYPKPEDGSGAQQQQQQQGWRPGFWSGLGAGALAAQAARLMREGGQRGYAAPPRSTYGGAGRMPRYFDNDDDDDGFGRGGGGRNPFGSAGPSGGGGGGDTHRSMGFGGSSVR